MTHTQPRPWTPSDLAVLQRDYGHRPAAEIAIVLNRTTAAVIMKAAQAIPSAVMKRNRLHQHKDQLIALHAQGLLTCEIAEKLGAIHSTILKWLKILNLTPNTDKARQYTAATQRQNRTARAQGHRTYAAYLAFRKRLKAQWAFPGCLGRGEVRVCQMLKEKGPATVQDMADTLGLHETTVRRQARHLLDRGVVAREELGRKDERHRYRLVGR